MAAAFARDCHPGRLMSPTLEGILEGAGRRLTKPTEWSQSRERNADWPKHVFHVLTSAPAIGGHTRWSTRWVDRDASRTHSLIITGTGGVPDAVAEPFLDSGGRVLQLAEHRDCFARAYAVRSAIQDDPLVLLATDPADVVPSIAFAARSVGPTVVRLNHAQHLFWLGSAVTDLQADFFPPGAHASMTYRGIDELRCICVPLPIDAPAVGPREIAREQLRVPTAATVVLTVGAPYKFISPAGTPYLELIEPVLAAVPELVVVAVGPEPTGRWRAAVERWGGRLLVPGPQTSTLPYLAAADLYFDSYPIGSYTALLEAAAAGRPVLRYQPPGWIPLLQGDEADLDGCLLRLTDRRAIFETIRALSASRDLQQQHGLRVKAAVTMQHGKPGWRAALDDLYERARFSVPASCASLHAPAPIPECLDTALSHVNDYRSIRRFVYVAHQHSADIDRPTRYLTRVASLLGQLALQSTRRMSRTGRSEPPSN